ncbi:MAG TPA: DUF3566 domain-containing protein [Opitutaceae bacterium]|jgi:hypothetical protein|nr:DUF3566 domain-containing protein [Opitutaceae bacterium]
MNMIPPQLPLTKRRIKSITPLQLGKMLAIIYGGMSLLFIPFFLLFGVIASMAPKVHGGPPLPAIFGFGLGFALLFPLIYAAMGFVLGVIGAFIYNLVAKWIGGIEVEVE